VHLDSAEAKALVVDDLPMTSLGLWCQIAVEVAGEFHRLVGALWM
jgi:hypothetical protein